MGNNNFIGFGVSECPCKDKEKTELAFGFEVCSECRETLREGFRQDFMGIGDEDGSIKNQNGVSKTGNY